MAVPLLLQAYCVIEPVPGVLDVPLKVITTLPPTGTVKLSDCPLAPDFPPPLIVNAADGAIACSVTPITAVVELERLALLVTVNRMLCVPAPKVKLKLLWLLITVLLLLHS